MPRDREGRFSTEPFARDQRSENALAEMLQDLVKTLRKVQESSDNRLTITDETRVFGQIQPHFTGLSPR